ncbi:hypothetical protein RRU94_22210 [Domibacillus sp. DTU_2020_1001157_1_SI_ALB_TIR_016]|uniref:hypothetical protein n=1 Tax=Domibacillus sp. DTU_2020_1001157_1_SI_ALB_TIR_016 TaxID=3077789 RepID=UPI0028E7E2D4|nr:hypothetical protein [Domibacillus sp. DTU_2020_1001157_1_SI_ALB_TIR_016]WNS80199.1 hypothetical protein RRU94_22210 [Domibacillus sp. DTU_2020_1001157_1_SI_ALB_TIR_016]
MYSIQEKLDLLHNEIKEMGGIIDLDWCGKLLYTYYEHFNDNHPRYRAGSLLAFWGLLLDWEEESGFPFCTGIEEQDCHHFDKYLQEFLTYSSNIKKQYPNIYLAIVESLSQLDERDGWENEFPNIPSGLFNTARKKLLQNGVEKPSDDVYENVFREAEMPY